jgi:hypothetical protein
MVAAQAPKWCGLVAAQAARRRRRRQPARRNLCRRRLTAAISIVGALFPVSGSVNDGMWRSIWASTQARHEHSGTEMPV